MADRRPINPIDRTSPEAVAAWGGIVRSLVQEIRALSEDAMRPRGERKHSRAYLRRLTCRNLRELDARLDAIDPRPTI